MIDSEFIVGRISEISRVPQVRLTGNTALTELAFDSLQFAQLVSELDERSPDGLTDREIDDVYSATTVGDICRVLARDGGAR
jgi:acyl carrier protein